MIIVIVSEAILFNSIACADGYWPVSGLSRKISPVRLKRGEERLRLDAVLAERMSRIGIDPYASAHIQTYVDLATKGLIIEERGRPLRNIPLFRTVAARIGRQNIVSYRAYLAEQQIASSSVLRFVVRLRRGRVRIKNTRGTLKHLGSSIQDAARYVRGRFGYDLIMRKSEAEPHDGGRWIDVHAHCWAVPLDAPDLAGFREYMGARFGYYGEAEHEGDGSECDDYSGSKGPLKDTSALADEFLAEYLDQIKGLHLWSFMGGLKRSRHAHRLADEEAVELADDQGECVYAFLPCRHRPQRIDRRPADHDQLLAIRLAIINGELRYVAIVNNYTCWKSLSERYDLNAVIAAAQAFIDMVDTATQENIGSETNAVCIAGNQTWQHSRQSSLNCHSDDVPF